MNPRRHFLSCSAALAAGSLLPQAALGQSTARIQTLRGGVLVNGRRVDMGAVIRAGDYVSTLADGFVLFAVGRDAFMLRGNGEMRFDPSPEPFLVTGLRLISGALGAVFGRRSAASVKIYAPNVTAGIRGTGCYLEARGTETYFCTCYGTIEMTSNVNTRERIVATTRHHDAPSLFYPAARNGSLIAPGTMETHRDAELLAVAKAAGQSPPW
jgi:hypothetical protein